MFSVFSSDHCPFRYDDPQGKLDAQGRTSFRWVPNGIPGVETRLPILFSEGVVKGRIDLNRFVALTSTNHAKTYGLYPRKGTIAVGADADIAIWDPQGRSRSRMISCTMARTTRPMRAWRSRAGLCSPWFGVAPSCGRAELVGEKGFGTYLPREKSVLA